MVDFDGVALRSGLQCQSALLDFNESTIGFIDGANIGTLNSL